MVVFHREMKRVVQHLEYPVVPTELYKLVLAWIKTFAFFARNDFNLVRDFRLYDFIFDIILTESRNTSKIFNRFLILEY